MGWSGGNYTKGNNSTGGWVGDASLGIGIEAGRHDTQDDDFATGINQCLNKDGSNAATGNLNLGGYLPTNIGAGTAAAPAICAGNDINTGIFSPGADQIGVATNGVERVRVDSTGNVGIGTTSPANGFNVVKYDSYSGSNISALFQATKLATSDAGISIGSENGNAPFIASTKLNGGSGSATGIDFKTDASTRFSIAANGEKYFGNGYTIFLASGITSGAGTNALKYHTTTGLVTWDASSILVKDNIVDCPYGLDAVVQMQPRKYFRTDDEKEELGFVADELANVIPEVVSFAEKSRFTKNDEDTEMVPSSIAYDRLTSILCKAIQELNTKVEALEARIAALEA